MKVLSISTDRKLFENGSAVLSRSIDYAAKMVELHIIVFTLKKEGYIQKQINNIYVYPTNSVTQWFYVKDAYALGKKIVKENSFLAGKSVISTQDPFQTGFVGVRLSKKFGLPLQVQIHTDFLSDYFSGFFNGIRVIIASYVIPKAKAVRVVSEVIKDSLKTKYKNLKTQVDVLPVFIDVENILKEKDESETKLPPFEYIVFMASRLEGEKRIRTALDVFKKVLEKFPKVGLIIAGDGSQKNNLKNYAKKIGVSGNVIFLGWLDDVALYYLKANIFLLTSEYEGYGMTLLQAGAFGCPIVTTKVGVAKTNLFKDGQNSFVCSVGDVECLSKSVIDLLEHPEKRQLFKERMQVDVRGVAVSRNDYIEKYVSLLEELL